MTNWNMLMMEAIHGKNEKARKKAEEEYIKEALKVLR
jgi:hypothetical protein